VPRCARPLDEARLLACVGSLKGVGEGYDDGTAVRQRRDRLGRERLAQDLASPVRGEHAMKEHGSRHDFTPSR
jgi:hypothetical protein